MKQTLLSEHVRSMESSLGNTALDIAEDVEGLEEKERKLRAFARLVSDFFANDTAGHALYLRELADAARAPIKRE